MTRNRCRKETAGPLRPHEGLVPASKYRRKSSTPAWPALPAFGAPGGRHHCRSGARAGAASRKPVRHRVSWVAGELSAESKTFKGGESDIRAAHAYFVSANGLKRMEIRFDKSADQQLQDDDGSGCTPCRSTRRRSAKCWRILVFTAAGVPAPKTAWLVTLAVPVKYEKAYLGLYTVIEGWIHGSSPIASGQTPD